MSSCSMITIELPHKSRANIRNWSLDFIEQKGLLFSTVSHTTQKSVRDKVLS
jgi:hypothetical protein